ncbi:MAG: glycoside hydrolase family 92 protein [Ferruginibacter sp.]|nr:glycoside hydrolase family 92 protein [Ferruginibacter sp.]
MKPGVLPLCLLWFPYILLAQITVKNKQAVDYVNPLIGTPYAGFKKGLDGGGTVPAVGTPYAMTNFLAQTAEPKMGLNAYVYEEKSIIGFLASHQPTVWMGDYGYVSVMPQIGELKLLPKDRALPFEHSDEISHPYYYAVSLNAGNKQYIKGEIAAASRAAILQFTFPASEKARFIIQGINLNPEMADPSNEYGPRIKSIKGYVKIDTVKNEITGYNPDRMSAQISPPLPNFKGYFIIQCDKKIISFGTWDNAAINPSSLEQLGTRMGAYINFKTKAGEKITLRIGTSFISLEQARINMAKEIDGRSFAQLVMATRNTWQTNLACMQPEGITENQKAIFYTALFHTMQFPREFSEYGRYYSAFDDQVHSGISYTDFSLWDTYRALHPLLIFTQPDRVNGMITAMLQMYKEGGRLPMWPNPAETNIMISTHADAVIADAYVKGIRGYDVKLAYEAVLKDAMVPPDNDTSLAYGDRDLWTGYEARAGLTAFNSIGYVPFGKTAESVSRTIEYSSDNYSVAQMAKVLGKPGDYRKILSWSKNYKNLYDSTAGFILPKLADGSFVHFNPADKLGRQDGFTEGDQWTYLFGAMQDVPGMMGMMGGKEKFIAKLDENFKGNHYRHDNEPGHHYCYLYDYCGEPWKTQELIRKHTTENYRNQPLGINGNEDCGQMAAWYIFGVMGFYPVTPASGIYAIGAPQFPKLTLKFKVNNQPVKFIIIANKLSAQNKYIQKVQLDGKAIEHPFISHTEIIKGHQLIFEMGPVPNKRWK